MRRVEGNLGVADAVRFLRERAGVSARELSTQAGLSPAYVGKVEAGHIQPSLRAFAHIAQALKMTPQEIWVVVTTEGTEPIRDSVSGAADNGANAR